MKEINLENDDEKKLVLEHDELTEKIMKGLDLTFEKLLKEKIAKDASFVFSENGKIVTVRARDYKR